VILKRNVGSAIPDNENVIGILIAEVLRYRLNGTMFDVFMIEFYRFICYLLFIVVNKILVKICLFVHMFLGILH